MRELPTDADPTSSAQPEVRIRLAVRPRLPLLAGVLIAVLGLLFGGIATASAVNGPGPSRPVPPVSTATPHSAAEIPNVTLVENEIKRYYGDTIAANGDHVPSATGSYAKEVAKIESAAQGYLLSVSRARPSAKRAIVLDVDDTALNTYNYEIFSGFAYNPTTNAEYVNDARFPAVFGMPALAAYASSHGYSIFYLTGRPETQRASTVTNLSDVGFTAPAADHLFLKNVASPPSYLTCGATCTTIQYKTETRAHIESLGYDIVANFGDQYSDLTGGYGNRTFKLPNPMYYLP